MNLNFENIHLSSPTGHPPHVWTQEEKDKLRAALEQVAEEERRHKEQQNAG